MRKFFPIINSDFFFSDFLLITPILYPIFSILALLVHQALLASLLRIINNINSYKALPF